jgi:two-component system cell cycle response regulator DivK
METILVVEDHEPSRDALSRRLERRGYRVVAAADGEQAVALARASVPDLILMDLGLPRLDGWGVTRHLKSEPGTRHIPIIVVSAHAGGENAALAAGGDALDTKPVHFEGLLTKIETLLRRRPAGSVRCGR